MFYNMSIAKFNKIIDQLMSREMPSYIPSKHVTKRGTKSILSFSKYVKEREDGLFEGLFFARDFCKEDGYLGHLVYSVSLFEDGVTNHHNTFCIHRELCNHLSPGDKQTQLLLMLWGADWLSLGKTEQELTASLQLFIATFLEDGCRRVEKDAKKLRKDPILAHAISMFDSIDPNDESEPERISKKLSSIGKKTSTGYPPGRVADQLWYRRKGNEQWPLL